MQSIVTKYLPPTNCKGSRYKATCAAAEITVSANHALGIDDNHEAARRELCRKMAQTCHDTYGSPLDDSLWTRPMVTGGLPNGDFVHVFLP